MIQEIDVPDGKVLVPYEVDEDMIDIHMARFASFVPIEYVLDDDGIETEEEKYTVNERARQWITSHLDEVSRKRQESLNRQADRKAGRVQSGGIS